MKNVFTLLFFLSGFWLFAQPELPVTFDDANIDYNLIDFGGATSSIVADPTDASNMVAQTIKMSNAEIWAGTTMGANGFTMAVPFASGATQMTVRVWSPDADIPVRLKAEDSNNGNISVETEAMTTMAGEWETLTFDFANQADGTAAIDFNNTYDKVSIFFNFGTDGPTAGEKTYYWDDIQFIPGGTSGPSLPVTFDNMAVNYDLVDFGGNMSMVVVDPTDANNMVAQSVKTNTAELWAGTTMGTNGFPSPIPFNGMSSQMTVRVWSPDADIPVRLKVEDSNNPTITVETEAMTTVAGGWETLTFDFLNQVDGTAALDLNNSYNKASIFFNFGTDGATAGEKTYYWDDVEFILNVFTGPELPVTFDNPDVDYDLVDFGENMTTIIVDPTDANNMVAQSIKPDNAELWAGTSIGLNGFPTAIPFNAQSTEMTVRVWSTESGYPVRLKVENSDDPGITVETEATTTISGDWETLTFDFANHVDGTAPLNLANAYNKASIFFNFGTDGATAGTQTYLWDDVEFMENMVAGPELPVTFEDDMIDYNLTDFGGNVSMIVVDPTNADNMVAQSTKLDNAELWAGTSIGANGFGQAIPFNVNSTSMTVRVWSPDANIPVRLKVEDSNNPTISVETEAMTTMANEWETLTFDFANHVDGTAAINYANSYNKASIFFNFGTDGATAGEKTYYWDDVEFNEVVVAPLDLPITFDDANVDYNLVDFGGNSSSIIVDPADANNMVVLSTKGADAQIWAGTTAGGAGLASPIAFNSSSTVMTVSIWAVDAGVPVRLKVENVNDPGISVETESITTIGGSWHTVSFDFANHVDGTAPIDFNNAYNKVSIFFNFGTDGATAGEQMYLWDDVAFNGVVINPIELPITFEDTDVNYDLVDFGGNTSMIVVDPTDITNKVAQSTKLGDAQLWAGTTAGGVGLAEALPFGTDETFITVRVWSPDANIPVRLKVEDKSEATISVETEAMTTVAAAWDTLVFDFSNHVDGTAAIDFNNVYDKVSIFFNFGTDGATAGEKTYYWDDVAFGNGYSSVRIVEARDFGLAVSPNPVVEEFRIMTSEFINETAEVSLFDETGRLVQQQSAKLNDDIISVRQLPAGLYIISVAIDQQIITQPITILK